MRLKYTTMWKPTKKKVLWTNKKNVEVQCDNRSDESLPKEGVSKEILQGELKEFVESLDLDDDDGSRIKYLAREGSRKRLPTSNLMLTSGRMGKSLKLVKTALQLLSLAEAIEVEGVSAEDIPKSDKGINGKELD